MKILRILLAYSFLALTSTQACAALWSYTDVTGDGIIYLDVTKTTILGTGFLYQNATTITGFLAEYPGGFAQTSLTITGSSATYNDMTGDFTVSAWTNDGAIIQNYSFSGNLVTAIAASVWTECWSLGSIGNYPFCDLIGYNMGVSFNFDISSSSADVSDPANITFSSSSSPLNEVNWAFSDGTIIPIPATGWLFGSAILGLISIGKKHKS